MTNSPLAEAMGKAPYEKEARECAEKNTRGSTTGERDYNALLASGGVFVRISAFR